MASRLTVFEIDQPGTQAWKRQRLIDCGFDIPDWLKLVPVDFEADASWLERLRASGFDAGKPAVVGHLPGLQDVAEVERLDLGLDAVGPHLGREPVHEVGRVLIDPGRKVV